MIRLVGVELTRLRWRRAVLVLLALAVVVPAVILGVTVHNTSTQTFAQLVEEQGPFVLEEAEHCERRPRQYGVRADGDVRAACERLVQEWYGNAPLSLTNEREQGTGIAVIVLLTMLMLLIGTTFAGHDWNTGSMSNQVLFEPRRARVWAAKAGAVLLVTGAASVVVLVAYWTGLWAVANARDISEPGQATEAAFKQAALGATFASLAGVVGYALTMFFRSTVATLGTLFAVVFVGAILAGALGLARYERVMPWGNFQAFTVGSYSYYVDSQRCFEDESECRRTIERSDASTYFGLIFVGVMAPSLVTFRRRDVP